MNSQQDLPEQVDWSKGTGQIYKQGGCQACYTFVTAAVVEGGYYAKTGLTTYIYMYTAWVSLCTVVALMASLVNACQVNMPGQLMPMRNTRQSDAGRLFGGASELLSEVRQPGLLWWQHGQELQLHQ